MTSISRVGVRRNFFLTSFFLRWQTKFVTFFFFFPIALDFDACFVLWTSMLFGNTAAIDFLCCEAHLSKIIIIKENSNYVTQVSNGRLNIPCIHIFCQKRIHYFQLSSNRIELLTSKRIDNIFLQAAYLEVGEANKSWWEIAIIKISWIK